MILHNVMWESRPLPKIVRDPLAALSARGSFFMLFPLLAHGGLRKISRPACDSDRPRYQPGIFLFWWKSLRRGKPFWKKVLPPRAPPFQKLLPVGLRKDGKSEARLGWVCHWARPWHYEAGSCGYRAQRVGEWGLCPEADSAGNKFPGCGNFSGDFFSLGIHAVLFFRIF